MPIPDDANTLAADIAASVKADNDAATATLAAAQANVAALQSLQSVISAALTQLNVQIAGYQSIVTPPPPAPPAPTA